MPESPFVLVTGASRGLGRDMALHLTRHGFKVLAGVRSPEDGTRLTAEAGPTLHPVILDVADSGSIAVAVATVADLTGEAGLAGLVNNAGIASFVPLEQQPMDDFERTFRVNVIGVQALTQALLPQLRRARGRIVNISSGNGKLSFPFSGAYSASKFALEALSDALRVELAPWGIQVSVVEPGAMATDIRVKGIEAWAAAREALSAEDRMLYASQFERIRSAILGLEAGVSPVDEVSEAVLLALTAVEPKTRYPVGPNMDQLDALATLPDRARDQVAMGILGLGGAPPSPA